MAWAEAMGWGRESKVDRRRGDARNAVRSLFVPPPVEQLGRASEPGRGPVAHAVGPPRRGWRSKSPPRHGTWRASCRRVPGAGAAAGRVTGREPARGGRGTSATRRCLSPPSLLAQPSVCLLVQHWPRPGQRPHRACAGACRATRTAGAAQMQRAVLCPPGLCLGARAAGPVCLALLLPAWPVSSTQRKAAGRRPSTCMTPDASQPIDRFPPPWLARRETRARIGQDAPAAGRWARAGNDAPAPAGNALAPPPPPRGGECAVPRCVRGSLRHSPLTRDAGIR